MEKYQRVLKMAETDVWVFVDSAENFHSTLQCFLDLFKGIVKTGGEQLGYLNV